MTQAPPELSVGLLGGTGWLGKALGQNLLRRGLAADHLHIANRRGPTADYDAWPGIVWAPDLASLASSVSVLVLSVRPEDYTVATPQPFDGIVISFMAGVTLDRLALDWPRARTARAMPGGGATEGTAHVPWCANGTLHPADADCVAHILSAIGHVDRVADETQLAVMAALSGSGAAYPALMAQAMYRHAVAQGIASDIAWRATVSVVCDAARQVRDSIEATEALLAAYHGYRGVTAAGLIAAETAGFSTAISRALQAATAKAVDF